MLLALGFYPLPDVVAVQPPAAMPQVIVTLHDGRRVPLRELVTQGKVAVQLMYTSCTTTCPLLGGLFRRVDHELASQPAGGIKLISITVDPEHDRVQDLVRWRKELHASDRWIAIRADRGQLVQILATLNESDHNPRAHSSRVYILEGRPNGPAFVGVTGKFPKPAEIADAIR